VQCDPAWHCDDGIGKEARPVSDGTIGSKDNAFGAEAAIDDCVEAFGGELIEALESKIVD
jgi:hypothetical protein